MTHTHVTTYARITPACPYLACGECHARVEFWLDRPGPHRNEPCGHEAEMVDTCPSWSPVDGCRCVEHLRARPVGHLPDPDLRMVWMATREGTRRVLVTLPDNRARWTIDDPHAEALRRAQLETGITEGRAEIWSWPPAPGGRLEPEWVTKASS